MALRAWLCGGGVKMSCCSQVLHFNGNDPWLDRYLQNDQEMFENLLKEAMAEAINFERDGVTKRTLAQMVARNESEISVMADVIRTRFDSSTCRSYSWYSRYIFSGGSLLSLNNFETNTELGTFHSANNYNLCMDSSFMREEYKGNTERTVLLYSCRGERVTVLDSQYIRFTKSGRILTQDGWCWTVDPQQDSVVVRKCSSSGQQPTQKWTLQDSGDGGIQLVNVDRCVTVLPQRRGQVYPGLGLRVCGQSDGQTWNIERPIWILESS